MKKPAVYVRSDKGWLRLEGTFSGKRWYLYKPCQGGEEDPQTLEIWLRTIALSSAFEASSTLNLVDERNPTARMT